MRGAWVIAKKDLRTLFLSPLFYILTGICSLVWTLIYAISVREFVNRSMMQMVQSQGQNEGLNLHFNVIVKHISLVNLLMIFAVGALTMRLFTEEKKNRTFDLLLTAPVTATEITLGKLIAGLVTALAVVFVSLLYPLSLGFFGEINWGPLLSSYIGLSLLVGAYVAIGMFASSLTQSAVLSVVMSIIFSILLWFIGIAGEVSDDPWQKALFDHVNVSNQFFNFVKGNISLAGLVFFVSVIFLFTFLTQRVIESLRWR